MENLEEKLDRYISRGLEFNTNEVNAVIGKISAARSQDLANSINFLNEQIRLSTVHLRKTIDKSIQDIIDSNVRLATSNESYAWWAKWMTFALVVASFMQVVVTYLNNK